MPGLTTTPDVDSPVRVVVTPSQSSYFAGEPFTVTITFTNTRSPEAGPSRPTSHSHKRGAHSISSAPLARPPTSPGTPRSAALPSTSRTTANDELPRRKGLIGKTKPPPTLPTHSDKLPELLEQRRKRQLVPKSLSVSVSPFQLEDQLAEAASSAPYSQRSFYNDSRNTPTTPNIPSPLARTDTLPLSSDHPHARKQSILDGQFSLDVLSPTTSVPPFPYSPNSSTSTFSLALDPIAEAALSSPYPSTPAIGLPTIEPVSFSPHTPITASTPNLPPNNSVYAYPPPRQQQQQQPSHTNHHRPAPLGLGQPSNSPRGYLQPPRSAFASTFPPPNNELILYSYAQLTGTVLITPVAGALPTPEQSQTLNAVRSALLNRSVLGGGSMDITSTLNPPTSPRPRHRQTHSRSSSFSAGLLSILSPTSLVASISAPAPGSSLSRGSTRWRSSSSSSGPFTPTMTPNSGRFPNSGSPGVLGFGSGPVEEIDPEEPLPTFEIQSAMLAVDLSLAPGESRSYTYSVRLPDNLPPTFKGKSLKFSYELVVGTCRAGASGGGGGGGGVSANSISRVMKVPIRVYNHVSVGRSLKPYDLLWPVSRRQDVGMPGTEAKVVEECTIIRFDADTQFSFSASTSPSFPSTNTLESIQEYARSLLASLPDPLPEDDAVQDGPSSSEDAETSASSAEGPSNGHGTIKAKNGAEVQNGKRSAVHHRAAELRRTESERERVEEGSLAGCREAVEILTRNPKKASYDVNKDGVKVAVLTFAKSAYRLGETVTGVVELNERTSRARVLKLSAILESHETLPSTISPASSARHLRRAHAESHSSFTLNTLRTTFSLDIPSDASPAFQIRVGTPPNPPNSGVEWKVRLCLLVGIAAETSWTGVQGVRFKGLMRDGPRGEWGSSWHATPGNAPLEKPNLKAEALAAAAAAKRQSQQQLLSAPRTWSRYIVSSLLYGNAGEGTEREYHDGDILGMDDDDEEGGGIGGAGAGGGRTVIGMETEDGYDGIIPDMAGGVGVGVDYAGGEEGWRDVKLETVECEVPVKVFPGNTAFKALDVVFDV
ncbi:hypothetical protein GALMADRAFT_231119 [Galerina marginata CBS 339.88]|uniref:Rgp1-domain-containing protein n=1 Tax=Galerina marginata (strain CBS 339.88) TaxID=685588 RepID=A0A067SD25_GALM3|nr:hypothetical protein GALMADRAFT_231119 [Galerina marginata CBS 339.88]